MEETRRRILIVDDNEINRMILSELLKEEYDLMEAENGRAALELIRKHAENLTLVLLDVVMPEMDGFEVLAAMNAEHLIEKLPVIMISAETAPPYMRRAYDLGAVDYINRPFDQYILQKRISNTIVFYARQKDLTRLVEEQVSARDKESRMMVAILSHIVEIRNGESGKHVQDINILTRLFLKHLLGKTNRYNEILGDIDVICMASSLHDIGKIGIPSEILNKPGPLNPEEIAVMRTHSMLGARTMESLPDFRQEPLIRYAYQICRWHHERWDGGGYPDGLKGNDIPIAAQVVSLADVYDALTSERCYKEAFSHEKSMRMILNGECGRFNPVLLECLTELGNQIPAELKRSL